MNTLNAVMLKISWAYHQGLKGDQVRYYSALYRQNLLISWCQSGAFMCGLMNLCSFARHHRPHMLCNDIGWQEQSMWELKMLAGCHTCLMWITDSAGAGKQKTSTMNTLTLQALLSCRATSAHCPPPLVTAAPWAPVLMSLNSDNSQIELASLQLPAIYGQEMISLLHPTHW